PASPPDAFRAAPGFRLLLVRRDRLGLEGMAHEVDGDAQEDDRAGERRHLQHQVTELRLPQVAVGVRGDHQQAADGGDDADDEEGLGAQHVLLDHGAYGVDQLRQDEDHQQAFEELDDGAAGIAAERAEKSPADLKGQDDPADGQRHGDSEVERLLDKAEDPGNAVPL